MIIHVQFGFFQASDITLSINAECCLYFRRDYFEIISLCMIDNLFLCKAGQRKVPFRGHTILITRSKLQPTHQYALGISQNMTVWSVPFTLKEISLKIQRKILSS